MNWEEEKDNIEKMVASGKSMESIGKKYGVSKQRIYQLLTKFGISTNAKTRKSFLRDKEPKYYWLNRMLCNKKFPKEARTRILNSIVVPEVCPVLGIKLNYTGTGIEGWSRKDDSPSIDQIIPGKGYTEDNIVVISWRANRIKNDGTPEEHFAIYDYFSNLTK